MIDIMLPLFAALSRGVVEGGSTVTPLPHVPRPLVSGLSTPPSTLILRLPPPAPLEGRGTTDMGSVLDVFLSFGTIVDHGCFGYGRRACSRLGVRWWLILIRQWRFIGVEGGGPLTATQETRLGYIGCVWPCRAWECKVTDMLQHGLVLSSEGR